MGDWAYLRVCRSEPRSPSDLDAAPVLLRAKYYVPTHWPALFGPAALTAAHEADGCPRTRPADAAARLRKLWSRAADDPRFAALWEACAPVAEWLEGLAPESSLALDVRELVGDPEEQAELAAELARAAEGFATLESRWSSNTASTLLPKWLRDGTPAMDPVAARRWTRTDSPRAAFFSVAFGWPDDDAITQRWQPWFDAGPPALPMPDPADEASRLRQSLAKRGLVTFSEQPSHQRWIGQFLGVALRERTAEVLAEVLQVLQARGAISALRASPSELEDTLREMDVP